jgi:hypothetical protein
MIHSILAKKDPQICRTEAGLQWVTRMLTASFFAFRLARFVIISKVPIHENVSENILEFSSSLKAALKFEV